MNKRRLFASAMAACMLLSTMPSTALAAEPTDAAVVAETGTGPAAGTNDPTTNTPADGTGSDINAGGNTEVENTNKLPDAAEDENAHASYKSAVKWYNNLVDEVTWRTLSNSVYWYGEAMKVSEITSNTDYKANLDKIKAYYESITELSLSGQDSTATGDTSWTWDVGPLAALTNLVKLDLSNTKISNVGALKSLTKLETLNLSGNTNLDNDDLGTLIGLPLETLNLSGTSITEIGSLSHTDGNITENKIAKTLTTLDISNTNVTKLETVWGDKDTTAETAAFPALKNLTAKNLQLVSISGLIENIFKTENPITCDLTGSTLNGNADALKNLLTAVKYHQKLLADIENKDVKWNNLVLAVAYYNMANAAEDAKTDGYYKTTLENIGNIYAGITELDMSNEALPDKWDLGALAAFTNLEKLNLSNANIIDKQDENGEMTYALGALAGLTTLETLDVSGNPGITDLGGLENLTALTELNVSGATVDNEDLGALIGLNLTELDLSGTDITDIGGLTNTDETHTTNSITNTLITLDISDTAVTKLESVWNEKAEFPALKTLTAHNLALDSISGLMEIAEAEGFDAEGLTWDFTDSTLFSDPNKHINQIKTAFGDNAENFIPPEVSYEIDTAVKPSVGGSEVTVPEDSGLTADNFAGTTVDSEVLMDQAGAKAAEVSADEDIKEKATEQLGDLVSDDDEVTVHVQTYMDVQVTDYQAAEGETTATLTLNITPKYKLIASTESDSTKIVTTEGNEQNAVVMKDSEGNVMGGELTITTPVTVTIPLPSGFATGVETLYVKHVTDDDKTYIYTATVINGKATFTNPNGFSLFTVSQNDESAAKIGNVGYTSLDAAVNAALAATETATIEIVGTETPSVTVNTPGSFIVKGNATINKGGNVTMNVVDNGDGTKTYTFTTYTAPSYGGDYTPSNPTYNVSVPTKVENGSVSVSAKNPTKGSTVTLTVTPDKGYELDTLTVTDKNGNKIALTDLGNGKYSFTMPASKVNVKATFVETPVEPEAPVNPFYDVAETDYFFDAVLWANENGITSGVGNGQFAPHATCTRAQMVTFLWNAAGCPNVSEDYADFTDVTANDYYYKAVLWAKANNITSGTAEGVFSPDLICDRAQMATFLYKFAEGKAVGTSNRFADVTASDYYAQPVQWAVENGITSGTGDTTFGPNDPCTRAQMVTFLYRLLAE